ncbi:hypothetical protein Bsel_2671 [[Bacillus] selenitireducens MLS10]|uniref:Uncharacterized protein n=1 Tax=Bacillus selenitireducens (strain ATCC 700615 / DSM 15326 / MLS10) TaxID=439292 RepID=D6XYA1_BACIE|nr:hypothetical protein Bsel_2671 [[Bacillus] selenitireducens MLS10]
MADTRLNNQSDETLLINFSSVLLFWRKIYGAIVKKQVK